MRLTHPEISCCNRNVGQKKSVTKTFQSDGSGKEDREEYRKRKKKKSFEQNIALK